VKRRQGDTSAVCIGAFNQWTKPRQAAASGPGPLSEGACSPADCVSEGVSQYGVSSTTERLVFALAESGSDGAAVIDSFRSVPSCSWNALIVLRKLRANQTPATRKAHCERRLPTAYQLISDQELKSFMFLPLGRDRDQVSSRNRRGELVGSPRNEQVRRTGPMAGRARFAGTYRRCRDVRRCRR